MTVCKHMCIRVCSYAVRGQTSLQDGTHDRWGLAGTYTFTGAGIRVDTSRGAWKCKKIHRMRKKLKWLLAKCTANSDRRNAHCRTTKPTNCQNTVHRERDTCTEEDSPKCSLASGKRLWANETAGERGSALV